MELLLSSSAFWLQLFATTIIQIALSADNLIVMSLQASKLSKQRMDRAINYGLLGSMIMRIGLLLFVTWLIQVSSEVLFSLDSPLLKGEFTTKSILFFGGGIFLMVKGAKEIIVKMLHNNVVSTIVHNEGRKFWRVVGMIILVNLFFSIDSTFVVVGMTDMLIVMICSVVISLLIFLFFAKKLCHFIQRKPAFEVIGLMLLLPIGWHLTQEGASEANTYIAEMMVTAPSQISLISLVLFFFIVGFIQDIILTKKNKPNPEHLLEQD